MTNKKRDPNAPMGIGQAIERCIKLDRECIERKRESADRIGADYTRRIEAVIARVPDDLRPAFMAALAAAVKTELVSRALGIVEADAEDAAEEEPGRMVPRR